MHNILNILMAALIVLCLSQAQDVGNSRRKHNFDILFVKDMTDYLNAHSGLLIKLMKYRKADGFTFGTRYNKKLFDLELKLDYLNEKALPHHEFYTHPGNGTLDIKHVQFNCTNIKHRIFAFVSAGGIGQSFVSLLVEVNKKKGSVCYVKISGDVMKKL